jgi:hypothetical protein
MHPMHWVELFAAFIVCHLVGDFLLQTDWQARNKHEGLGTDRTARRALAAHLLTYTLAFVPALIWVGNDQGVPQAFGAAALLVGPHVVQDDGRLIAAYVRRVKGIEVTPSPLMFAVDQSFHVVALFLVALLIGD